jgi:hypothetical protein
MQPISRPRTKASDPSLLVLRFTFSTRPRPAKKAHAHKSLRECVQATANLQRAAGASKRGGCGASHDGRNTTWDENCTRLKENQMPVNLFRAKSTPAAPAKVWRAVVDLDGILPASPLRCNHLERASIPGGCPRVHTYVEGVRRRELNTNARP